MLRRILFLSGLALILAVTLYKAAVLEVTAHAGREVVLEISPLYRIRTSLRGNHINLQYEVDKHLERNAGSRGAYDGNGIHVLDDPERYDSGDYRAVPVDNGQGTMALVEDEQGVARFSRLLEPGQQPAEDEIALEFPRPGGSEARAMRRYYFRKVGVERSTLARFAVLRVDEAGRAVLVEVLDENRKPLWDNTSE